MLITFVLLVLFFLYFLPSCVAVSRKHKNTLSIILLNLFLGWLFVPWVIALVWSTMKDN